MGGTAVKGKKKFKPVKSIKARPLATPTKKTAAKPAAAPPPIKVKPPSELACGHCGVVFKLTELAKHQLQEACGVYLQRAGITQVEARGFTHAVEVAPPTKEQAYARTMAMAAFDVQGHMVLEVRRTESAVTYVPFSGAGMCVERMAVPTFDTTYKAQANYPTGRAATLLVGYSLQLGGTSEAMAELGKLVLVTSEEMNMATAKLAGNKTTSTKTVAVDAGKYGVVKVKAERKTRDSAASMYEGLIMEGGLTDEQIFAQVKKTWPESKGTVSYVGWYRNRLKKAGKNPPAKKEDGKPAEKAAAPAKAKKPGIKQPAKKS